MVQRNLNLFEVCGGNGVVSLVPHHLGSRSSSPPKYTEAQEQGKQNSLFCLCLSLCCVCHHYHMLMFMLMLWLSLLMLWLSLCLWRSENQPIKISNIASNNFKLQILSEVHCIISSQPFTCMNILKQIQNHHTLLVIDQLRSVWENSFANVINVNGAGAYCLHINQLNELLHLDIKTPPQSHKPTTLTVLQDYLVLWKELLQYTI